MRVLDREKKMTVLIFMKVFVIVAVMTTKTSCNFAEYSSEYTYAKKLIIKETQIQVIHDCFTVPQFGVFLGHFKNQIFLNLWPGKVFPTVKVGYI